MKSIDLVGNIRNPKTHLPVRYVSPIVAESLVRSASNSMTNVPYQRTMIYNDDKDASCDNIWQSTTFVSSRDNETDNFATTTTTYPEMGQTHLWNQGLFTSDFSKNYCCPRSDTLVSSNKIVSTENVYDPRFNGFCTDEWRSFVNPLLGRVEYDYSDVDSLKKQNFIQRISIGDDTLRNGASAVDHFSEMELQRRNDLQLEWLQRRSSDRLQAKLYPKHTNGNKLN